jgi:hypothetical protein
MLAARGGFLVPASRRHGGVRFVELKSRVGQPCCLRNPWPEHEVTLHRDGKPAERLRGDLFRFPTRPGETLVLLPAEKSLPTTPYSVPEHPAPSDSSQ